MSSIRPYIIINGKNSNEINGLIISSLPPISKPPMRAMSEEIDGRDGDIITKLGFSAYDKTIQIGLAGTYDVNAVIEYFNQEGVIIFSNEADKYYRFTQLNGIDFEKLIRFKTASVTFHCQPFKYSNSESPLNFFEPQTVEVTNSGNIYSKPELAITGKGFVDMKINNQDVLSLDFGESQQTLIIDSEKMNCYGARSNINKLDVAINPQQDLNGYESVWLAPNDLAPYRTRINSNIGNLALEKLVGCSVCFNQALQISDIQPSSTQLDITITNNGNGTVTFNGTANATGWIELTNYNTVTYGHVYFIGGSETLPISDGYPSEQRLIKWEHTGTLMLYVRAQSGVTYNETIAPQIIDLTAMFGSTVADYIYTLESGTAGAGVSLFKSLFADEYYPYTANTLMSAKPTGKKIVGKNIYPTINSLQTSTVNGITFTRNNDGSISVVGTATAQADFALFGTMGSENNAFSVNAGEYTISVTGCSLGVGYIFGGGDGTSGLLYDDFRTSPKAKTVTLKKGTTGHNIIRVNAGETVNTTLYIQWELANQATAYEPYSETTIVYSGNELRGILKVGNNGLYADGDIDDGSGSTTVRYEQRAYQSGDESLTDAITDGTNTVVKLAIPTTAVSTAWTNPIIAKSGGTEEFTDSRTIKMFSGHDTIYGNICAINGWNECSVYRNGVNQWDEVTEAGSIDATTGANATDSSKLRSKNYIAVKSGKSYYFHTNNYDVNIYGYDSNKAFVSAIGTATKDESITIPNGIDYLRFVIESGYGTTYNHDISINYPSTITSYIEFEGVSNTFELGNDIVYGGVLDVATGILKLSCGLNTLGAFNYTYSDGYFKTDDLSDVVKAPADHDSKIKSVCEAFVYRKWNELANYDNSYAFDGTTGELRIKCSEITDASSFKSLMRNIHILYEVINPVEIQLTAWEIMSLIGENNIFANTGEIENCVYTKDGSEHEASGDIITFTINAHDIISDILRNRLVTGNYDNVRFKIGKNTITFIGLPDESQNVGEVDELSVSNYSRWL